MPIIIPTGSDLPAFNIYIGRLGLAAAIEPVGEQLGSEITVIGDATAVGQRRVKGFTLSIAVHGTPGDIPDAYTSGQRMRRQLRAIMQNAAYRLAGVYISFSPDPERNGWMVLATGTLLDADGGVTFAEYQLNLDQAYKVGDATTHREGYRVDLTDLRLTTSPLDYYGKVINTSAWFAGLPALPLIGLPTGAHDASILDAPANFLGTRFGSDGAFLVSAFRSDGDVISWERPVADFNQGDVVVYDRRGNTSALPTP